jgi:hypothetical protein
LVVVLGDDADSDADPVVVGSSTIDPYRWRELLDIGAKALQDADKTLVILTKRRTLMVNE